MITIILISCCPRPHNLSRLKVIFFRESLSLLYIATPSERKSNSYKRRAIISQVLLAMSKVQGEFPVGGLLNGESYKTSTRMSNISAAMTWIQRQLVSEHVCNLNHSYLVILLVMITDELIY